MQNLNKVLKKAAKGHRKSQYLLYEDYYGYAMSVALRFCSEREEAKEIVHDSFLKAFTKLDTVISVSSFKPWFRRIIVNTSIDYFRRNKHQMNQLDILENDSVDLSASAVEQLSAEEILGVVQELTPAYRMVFTLYVVEGYKHEEIAKQLGISMGTSKSNLAKARVKLQRMISERFGYDNMSHG